MPTTITARVDGKTIKTVLNQDKPRCPYHYISWLRYRKYRCPGRLIQQTEYLPGYTLQIVCDANSHHSFFGRMEKIRDWRPTEDLIRRHVEQTDRKLGKAIGPQSIYPLKL